MDSSLRTSGEKCAICLDIFDYQPNCEEKKQRQLACSHIFHKECIGKWLKSKHNCPLFRRDVEVKMPDHLCLSSQAMAKVLEWRHPKDGNKLKFVELFGKIIAAELALPVLCITAIIETIAYSIFTAISFTFSHLNKRPYEYFKELLKSSSFTIHWSAADVYYNLVYPHPSVNESEDRRFGFATIYPKKFLEHISN